VNECLDHKIKPTVNLKYFESLKMDRKNAVISLNSILINQKLTVNTTRQSGLPKYAIELHYFSY